MVVIPGSHSSNGFQTSGFFSRQKNLFAKKSIFCLISKNIISSFFRKTGFMTSWSVYWQTGWSAAASAFGTSRKFLPWSWSFRRHLCRKARRRLWIRPPARRSSPPPPTWWRWCCCWWRWLKNLPLKTLQKKLIHPKRKKRDHLCRSEVCFTSPATTLKHFIQSWKASFGWNFYPRLIL